MSDEFVVTNESNLAIASQYELVIPENVTKDEVLELLTLMVQRNMMVFWFTKQAHGALPRPFCNWELKE